MYRVIEQSNISLGELPRNGSLINYSLLRELKTVPVIFRSFSVKYVLEGCERYTVNGKRYPVTNGEYLLANAHSEGSVEIDSDHIVKGLCIDIAPEILSEVVASFMRPDTPLPDSDLDRFFTTADFFENRYPTERTQVGIFLQELGSELSASPHEKREFNKEFYYTLSEKLVADHIPVFRQLKSIPTVKAETRKELLRRVTAGKAFMDKQWMSQLYMEQVALECGLSEYHFFRLFKAVFGISPHQYLIRIRLEKSLNMLQSRSYSVSETAFLCGFSDIHSFSKAFKKQYGMAPTKLG